MKSLIFFSAGPCKKVKIQKRWRLQMRKRILCQGPMTVRMEMHGPIFRGTALESQSQNGRHWMQDQSHEVSQHSHTCKSMDKVKMNLRSTVLRHTIPIWLSLVLWTAMLAAWTLRWTTLSTQLSFITGGPHCFSTFLKMFSGCQRMIGLVPGWRWVACAVVGAYLRSWWMRWITKSMSTWRERELWRPCKWLWKNVASSWKASDFFGKRKQEIRVFQEIKR